MIAHELGHYAGGDTRLGPWIYRTRAAIGRTIDRLTRHEGDDSLTRAIVRRPFLWYGNAFLRITNAISRREEFAARRAGRAVHVGTLERIHAYAPAFDAYWQSEVVPALRSGVRPPVGDGFAAFIERDWMRASAEAGLERALAERTGPYDSHPALAERIAAVAGVPDGDTDDSPPAISLLDAPRSLEEGVLVRRFGAEAQRELAPVAWEAVGERVYLPRYESLAGRFPWVFEGLTLDELAAAAERREPDVLEPGDGAGFVVDVLAAASVLAVHRHGWTVEALPGCPWAAAAATPS